VLSILSKEEYFGFLVGEEARFAKNLIGFLLFGRQPSVYFPLFGQKLSLMNILIILGGLEVRSTIHNLTTLFFRL
jgi:hypothetical protein